MSAKRTLVVQLTEAQYQALAGAVTTEDLTLADLVDDSDPDGRSDARRRRRNLDAGWRAVNEAWHAAGEPLDDYQRGWVQGLVESHGAAAVLREVTRASGL